MGICYKHLSVPLSSESKYYKGHSILCTDVKPTQGQYVTFHTVNITIPVKRGEAMKCFEETVALTLLSVCRSQLTKTLWPV